MEAFQAIFNTVLIVFIVTTMLSAGFNTTFEQIASLFSKVWLVVAVLVVGFVVRPLVGWGTAEVFSLATPAFIAMALLWACPGAPFGAKLVMTAKADIQSGAVLQVMLASIGSITFAPTANAIIAAADLGDDVSLPVADLIKTVAALQLIPFAVGILTRHWAEERALEWNRFALKTSSITFVFVLAGALLGSWETVIDLIGSKVIVAALVASIVMIAIGYFVSVGESPTKQAAALVQPCTNSGPAFAAAAIAFDNDPEILGAITAILLFQIVAGLLTAVYFSKQNDDESSYSRTVSPQPASA
ncbi:bile acid:sodium symporter family protein [Ilumatobacter nonamiensis]|uniref:bile acid:sodium symporter family protein n=1 Tax=Ilumatobacter nonamiensis TaxID=467093 RepID=UPI00034C1432|nr:bile acid:sodium symporter [Ilumatobacter nonamiensis]